MKKIIMFALVLSSFLVASRYPIIFEYNYLSGCINGAGKIEKSAKVEYCICTLKAMEEKYSASEVLDKLTDPNSKKEIVNYVTRKCINILK